jgi:hypothetical protein
VLLKSLPPQASRPASGLEFGYDFFHIDILLDKKPVQRSTCLLQDSDISLGGPLSGLDLFHDIVHDLAFAIVESPPFFLTHGRKCSTGEKIGRTALRSGGSSQFVPLPAKQKVKRGRRHWNDTSHQPA